MRTIYRDNYTPQLGDYHDRLIIDGAQDKKWLFDCDGVYTEMDGAEVVNEKGDSTTKAISQKLFTDETNALAQDITDEANTRSDADRAIWQEIEDIEAASDVTDIVGTYADLEAYDTSKLKDNDIIKVLEDETQDDQITYYRWDKDTSTFSLIGAIGPYYTQAQADAKFQDKLTAGANVTIDANNEISATDTTYTAGTNISIDADNVISATDTTYSNFVGTDGVNPGIAGLVPAPATTDAGKFLKADGTWDTVSGGIDPSTTFWGQSVSLGAVKGDIFLNAGSNSGGGWVYANDSYNNGGIGVPGNDQVIFVTNRIRADFGGDTGATSSGGIGNYLKIYNNHPSYTDWGINLCTDGGIINMRDGVNLHDAATLAQGNTLSSGAPTSSTVGVLGQLLTDTTGVDLYQCTAIDTTDPNAPVYTWTQVGGSVGPTVVQTTGTSQTDVMSQEATSQLIYPSGYETTKNRIIIGSGASVLSATSYTGQIAIGVNAGVYNDSAIAIGSNARASGSNPYHWGLIAIGTSAVSTTLGSIAIGYNARGKAQYSTVIGMDAISEGDHSVALGFSAKTNSDKYSVALGADSKTRAQGVVDVSTGTNSNGYQGTNDQTRTSLRVISGVHDGEQPTDAATVSQAVGDTEPYVIADTDWLPLLATEAPYAYGVIVTAAHTIGANTICELINDNAVLFANHGFAIGDVTGQNVTLYAITAPTSSVTLNINYKG